MPTDDRVATTPIFGQNIGGLKLENLFNAKIADKS